MALGKWGDGGLWGHSAPNDTWNFPAQVYTKREALVDIGLIRRLSVLFTYVNAVNLVPKFANISVLAKIQKGQQLASHEALVDDDTLGIISLSISHGGGTDFVLSHTQLLVKHKKQRPRG